jgi:hypothetical protein
MKPQSLPIPSRESASTNQFSVLLSLTHALQPYLLLSPQELGAAPPPALDGGVVAAAATTFIKTCSKLDELLDDPSRWNLESQDALYDALVQTQEHQQRFLQMQTAAAASLMRPAFQLRPVLLLVEGGYIAVHGDLTSSSAVIGSGPTPEAALLDFDVAFQRKPEEQKTVVAEPPVEPLKKKRKK